jgi:hypothetical protein
MGIKKFFFGGNFPGWHGICFCSPRGFLGSTDLISPGIIPWFPGFASHARVPGMIVHLPQYGILTRHYFLAGVH